MMPEEPVMTGEEKFSVFGLGLPKKEVELLLEQCKGLKLCWDCEEKAMLMWNHIKKGVMVIGEMKVWDKKFTATYGFEYHPPFEFHAWIEERGPDGRRIIYDLGLPGVIIKGLSTCDEIGPILSGRKPVVLVGRPPKWIEYKGREFYLDRSQTIFGKLKINVDG